MFKIKLNWAHVNIIEMVVWWNDHKVNSDYNLNKTKHIKLHKLPNYSQTTCIGTKELDTQWLH